MTRVTGVYPSILKQVDFKLHPFNGSSFWFNGVNVDAVNEYACGQILIPDDFVKLHSIEFWGITLVVTPDGMQLQITIGANAENGVMIAYTGDDIFTSDSSNFAQYEAIKWTTNIAKQPELAQLTRNVEMFVNLKYAAASGSNIATNVCISHGTLRYYSNRRR